MADPGAHAGGGIRKSTVSARGDGATADSFWRSRIVRPIQAQLTQGVAPDRIALTLALGAALGTFPILGTTTVLCAAVAVALRLNQPIIQLVNYLVYPAQLALLIPFCRAGEWLFGAEPLPIFAMTALGERLAADPLQFAADYGRLLLYGVVAWGLAVVPLAVLTYGVLRPALQRAAKIRSPAA